MKIFSVGFLQIFLLILLCAGHAEAQEIGAKIKVLPNAVVRVEGKISDAKNAQKSWSFSQNFADFTGLGERLENFRVFDENGAEIKVKKFIAGEFEAEKAALSFAYDLNLKPLSQDVSAAHVSWLTQTHGILTTNDLFSQMLGKFSAKITFELPPNWQILTSENSFADKKFDVASLEKAVFAVGENLREKKISAENVSLSLAVVGDWQFTDDEAIGFAREIFSEHAKTFGGANFPKAQILLFPFPQQVNYERWQAETRGATVTIISAPTTFKSNSINRLQEQLRHEIFHLWLPNALSFTGNYDWFFEGFTYYQALKAGVRLNQIRFDDFLSTVGRGYDLTEALSRRRTISLLEASKNRRVNSTDLIYAKGTVTAFLCDATLIGQSKGKKNLDKIFREIYQKHRRPNLPEDGNTAILRILKQNPEIVSIIEKYVEGGEKFNPQTDLQNFGIEADKSSGATELKIVAKPSGSQKDLLDKLGYNQWRKIITK